MATRKKKADQELKLSGNHPRHTGEETAGSLGPEEDPVTGFYKMVLDEAEKLDFEAAARAEGLDDEITLLRVKIKNILEKDPKNMELLMIATGMLARLVKIRYSMNKKEEKNLGEAIRNVIRDIGIPLGVTVMNKKL